MNIAVVGAGIAGASTARQLAERGHSVTVFEQFPLGHDRGSSHGKSRVVRRTYPDRIYTEIMKTGYEMWKELEEACGQEILHDVGLLYFGHTDSPNLEQAFRGLAELAVPHEVLGASEMRDRFSQLRFNDDEIGIFTPEGGWVNAAAAVDGTTELARRAGAEFVQKKVKRDDVREFDSTVVCAGAWVREWWPSAPTRVTLQTIAYVQGMYDGPVWIEDSEDLVYGFPSVGGDGFKVGVHRQGPVWDAEREDRTPDEEFLSLILRTATQRFGLIRPQLKDAKGCLYTNTETEDFLVRRLDSKTWIASACSGHGFKFGPWMGNLLADLVEGKDELSNHPRFSG